MRERETEKSIVSVVERSDRNKCEPVIILTDLHKSCEAAGGDAVLIPREVS